MSYSVTVTNSVIDTTNIKNLLVQGESSHPTIVFSLSPTLTGLTWYVRSTYLSFNLTTESDAITPVETESAVTVTWTVDSSFTTLYGAAQLILVGKVGETTNVRAIGYINIARDWSGENQGAITLDLFEQLMAQAEAVVAKFPYIDETTGNWFAWNVALGAYEDTEVHAQGVQGETGVRGSLTFSGNVIEGTSTTPTAYATGITLAIINDRYRNTNAESGSYQNEYVCTLGGNAATALWSYDGNARGTAGIGVPAGGTTDQAIVKTSGTDYATGWADISVERTATLATGSWSGASAPYTQDMTITGVTTAGKPPIIDVVLSDTYATAQSELIAYGLVYRFKVTATDTVTAYATSAPATAINIQAKLVR